MSTTSAEVRYPDGQKLRESDINADASTLGDVLTSVDDGTGGKKAAWATSAIDPGVRTGTPGNLGPWTLQATPPIIVRNVGAALAEPVEFKPFRHYFNTNAVGAARIQVGNHRASGAGVELPLIYSLDAGASWAEAGPTVRLDRINFPEPGAQAALGAGAIGPNVMLNVGTKGGDGTTVIKVGDIVVDFTSSPTPPASPPGDPPDVPSGGPLGRLILDHNAIAEATDGRANVSAITAATKIVDRTGITGDAGPESASPWSQSDPTFLTAGFPGGLPCIRVAASQGLKGPLTDIDNQTFYFVVANITGAGSNGAGSDQVNGQVMATAGGNHSNGWVTVRADGKIQAAINVGSFGNPSAVGSANVSGTGPHIIRFAWAQSAGSWYVFVDGTLDASITSNILVNGTNFWGSVTALGYGNAGSAPTILIDYGRILCYDAAHTTSGLNAVELALQAIWGTP